MLIHVHCIISNHCATFQLVLSGDIEENPGPTLGNSTKPNLNYGQSKLSNATLRCTKFATKCPTCQIGVGTNRKHFQCSTCMNVTHATCMNLNKKQLGTLTSSQPYQWLCDRCSLSTLPFYTTRYILGDDSFNTLHNDRY